MNRSWHYRTKEWEDMALSGGLSTATSIAGMAFGGPLGMVAGYVLDQSVGKAFQPYFDKRAAVREFASFTDIADLNRGIGPRRMDAGSSQALAERFFQHDQSAWKYVPIVGDFLSERVGPKNKYAETFKKMVAQNLISDINPTDIDKIEERVKKTAEIMDKFAGLMHTTQETILQIKGKFASMGMGDAQQNIALNNLAKFTTGTGMTWETGLALRDNFSSIGKQAGYFKMGAENLQGDYGLQGIASIAALQNSGLISKSYDAATLGMQQYVNAVEQSRSSWGRVVERGGGNVALAKEYYENQGNGNAVLGMEFENLAMFGNKNNPLDTYSKIQNAIIDRLRANGMSEDKILAFLLRRETTKEGKEQAFAVYSGIGSIGRTSAAINFLNRRLEAVGEKGVATVKINDVLDAFSKNGSLKFGGGKDTDIYTATAQGRVANLYKDIMSGTGTAEGSQERWNSERYGKGITAAGTAWRDIMWSEKEKSKIVEGDLDLFYNSFITGGADDNYREAMRKTIMDKGLAKDQAGADAIIYDYFLYRKNKGDDKKIENFISKSANNDLSFLANYTKGRKELNFAEQKYYNIVSNFAKDPTKFSNLVKSFEGKSNREKASILRKMGLELDPTGLGRLDDETLAIVSTMALNDAYAAYKGIDLRSATKLGESLSQNYRTLLDNKSSLLDITDKNGKTRKMTETEYANRFVTTVGGLDSILYTGSGKDKKVKTKIDETALFNSLKFLTSNEDAAKGAARFLANNPQQVSDFMVQLNQQDFAATSKIIENAAKGQITTDPQTEAIRKFTDVLEKLNTALSVK
jgi:hypothetical protein